MRTEELPAPSCHSQCFLTPLSSSRTLSMHKDLEKFPGKTVRSRHILIASIHCLAQCLWKNSTSSLG